MLGTKFQGRPFAQVDVFGTAYGGNPVAVVLDGNGLSTAEMQRFARWTGLSETTFILSPTTKKADYRLRIFTTSEELPFAGHPTLGSAHAWALEQTNPPRNIVQECDTGLITVRQTRHGLAFAAPPLRRTGPIESHIRQQIAANLEIDENEIQDAEWVDNGPGWVGVLLADAHDVLRVDRPITGPPLGVIGPYPPGSEHDFEVRAFYPETAGMTEDPVTGSLNAGLAEWLINSGRAPERYIAHQGGAVGADGVVHVHRDEQGTIWVAGSTSIRIIGKVAL